MKKSLFPGLGWSALYLLLPAWLWISYRSLTLGVEWAEYLYPEGHFFETLGAGALLLAAAFCFAAFLLALRGRTPFLRQGLYAVMTMLFLLMAAVETGWAARLLPLPSGSEPGAVLEPENLLIKAALGFAVAAPIAWLALPSLRRAVRGSFPAALLGMAPFFLMNQAMSMFAVDQFKRWYRYREVRFPQALQEIKESNFEILCFFLALIAVFELGGYLRDRVTTTPQPQG